jgi:hypothetical protein
VSCTQAKPLKAASTTQLAILRRLMEFRPIVSLCGFEPLPQPPSNASGGDAAAS